MIAICIIVLIISGVLLVRQAYLQTSFELFETYSKVTVISAILAFILVIICSMLPHNIIIEDGNEKATYSVPQQILLDFGIFSKDWETDVNK